MRKASNCFAFMICVPAMIAVIALASAGHLFAEGSESDPATGSAAVDIYMVRLADAPVASYAGGIPGLSATSPRVLGQRRLEPGSEASIAYREFLQQQQDQLIDRSTQMLGRQIDVVFRYVFGNNGLAMRLSETEAAQVANQPGVDFVQKDYESELMTDVGPQWIGAPSIWDGSATGGLPGSKGEGVIVGIIDTGINPSNPSFSEVGPVDGYVHVNPWGAGNYVGVCDPGNPLYDPTFPCNDKLIGAWGYPETNGGDPRDYDGHGSHTASTAAGNAVVATVNAPTTSYGASISGVAPHANIVAYAACCSASSLAAAIDQIIIDGVDVVNYSIGSGSPSSPWTDFGTVGFLNAREAGVFVATSAGNAGSGDETVGGPADAPWLLSVGASTHNRKFLSSLTNFTGGSPLGDLSGAALTGSYGPAPIVHAVDFGDALCLNPFPAGTWTAGEIVVCDRGINGRIAKGANVQAGGAGGYVLANTSAQSETVRGDSHVLPAVHLGRTAGDALRAWLSEPLTGDAATGGGGRMAQIQTSIEIDSIYGDLMADFSSRGANRAVPDVVVPSVVAPGVDIVAAYGSNDAVVYDSLGGTSMASPHAAGAAALLTSLYPAWTPAEIQSALMLTANTTIVDDDGLSSATPFDMGSGRIDLSTSALAGLVLDVSPAAYLAANPSIGGDPKTLNLASLGNSSCCNCSWTRTFEATTPGNWQVGLDGLAGTVQPSSFTLSQGETQSVTVEVDTNGLPFDTWSFGELKLEETLGLAPDGKLPVAVKRTAAPGGPDVVDITSSDAKGVQFVNLQSSSDVTGFVATSHGLVQGTTTREMLTQDPTNGDPYDNLNDGTTFFLNVSVPVGAKRLVAEILSSSAPDLDLFVGSGLIPELAGEICRSTSSSSAERCDLSEPTTGDYWILVQNWSQSASAPDFVVLSHAVVGLESAGNLTVTGPESWAACSDFDISVQWHVPSPAEMERWYGVVTMGSDPSTPDNMGSFRVDLVFDKVSRWLFCSAPNVAIPDQGSVSSTLTIPETLDVRNATVHLDIEHSFVGDLIVSLEHVGGSASTLIDRPGVPATQFGCDGDNVDVVVDDAGPDGDIESQCGNLPAIFGQRQGGEPPSPVLAAFSGETMSGDWTLTVSDNAQADTGFLNGWCLEVSNNLIFADGFEMGDSLNWSNTLP